MQVQENDGRYREPRPLNFSILEEDLSNPKVRRVIVFPAYGKDGKPTKELRRAWRRAR